jgi:FkbM family methyltransferase
MRNPFQRAIRVRDQFAGRNIEFVMRYKHRGSVDHVADSIRIRGWQAFEPPLPLLIAALVGQPNSRFLDIGANSGFYSLIARQLGSSEVFAYEPVDSIAEAMAVNATLTLNARRGTLNEAGLHIIRKAVGSKRGRARIYLPSQHHGLLETSASLNSSFKEKHDLIEEVDVTTIDHEYLHHGCSKELSWVVKVDVESWE